MSRSLHPATRPIHVLAQLVGSAADGFLQIQADAVVWHVYLDSGKITYATHSVQPLERLDLHLRRFSHQIPSLNEQVLQQVREQFANPNVEQPNTDYQAICWLVNERYLNPIEAMTLIESLIREVLEGLLLLREGICEFVEQIDDQPKFCRLDLAPIIDYCRKRLQSWQALGPQIWSPHQRPYLFSQTQSEQKISPALHQKLSSILKGFSFRHLAVLLNKDELALAESLRPYILNNVILLREPKPPFDRLPRIPHRPNATAPTASIPELRSETPQPIVIPGIVEPELTASRSYTIACIDDSPTILNEMRRFLDDSSFNVHAINDPLKALMQVIRLKPDLILLDIGMPGIDGYKLCRLLRNHSLFSNTPIVMVTGNTGIIDRAKAKFVGASDYLTKPFTRSELLKVVFRHLS